MKITFMVTQNDDSIKSLDITQLEQQADITLRIEDSKNGLEQIIDTCNQHRPDSVVLIAKEPLRFRDDRRINLQQRLIDIGMNPASIGFVNLNMITLCAEDETQIVERLSLTADLAHTRVAHGSPLPMEQVKPVSRCLIIGDVNENEVNQIKEKGIHIDTIWSDLTAGKPSSSVFDKFSGLPGEYRITLGDDNGEKETIICGAVVINVESLNEDQKEQLAEAMKIPLPDGEFTLPPDRYVLTTGVWLINGSNNQINGQWPDAVSGFLNQEVISMHLDACNVDLDKCSLCGTCVKTCMFSANSIDTEKKEISFDQTRCTGCGNCVTACPVLARDLPHYSNSYMTHLVGHLQSFKDNNGVKILALFCENSGYKALNAIANAGKKLTPSYFFVPVKCGARIGTEIIPDSFRAGFDGVALLVCARDRCNDLVGSLDLERRFNLYRTIMKAQGQESGRMRIFSIKLDQLDTTFKGLEQFAEYLEDLQEDTFVF